MREDADPRGIHAPKEGPLDASLLDSIRVEDVASKRTSFCCGNDDLAVVAFSGEPSCTCAGTNDWTETVKNIVGHRCMIAMVMRECGRV